MITPTQTPDADEHALADLAALRDAAVAPAPVDMAQRERLWHRIEGRLGDTTQTPLAAQATATQASPEHHATLASPQGALLQSVYQHEGWTPLDDKADMKVLFDDGNTLSWLLRLAPGGTVLPHAHGAGAEECLVMAGTVLLNGQPYSAGDYQLALPGSRHERIESAGGCVVFLRSPSSRRRELALYAGAHRAWSPLQRAAQRAARHLMSLLQR